MGQYSKGAKTNYLYIVSDFIFGLLAVYLAEFITNEGAMDFTDKFIVLGLLFNIICMFINKSSNLYNITLFFYSDRVIKYITRSFIYTSIMISVMLFYVADINLNKKTLIVYLCFEYIFLVLSAFTQRVVNKKLNVKATRAVIIGDKSKFTKFVSFLDKSNVNINIIGYISIKYTFEEGYLGKAYNLEKILRENSIDSVYIMDRKDDVHDIEKYINICNEMGITVNMILGKYRKFDAHSFVSSIGTYPVVTYHRVTMNKLRLFIKRLVDIVGSIVGIVAFSPFMIVTALAIKIEDPKGPIIFKQKRVGMNGRQFFIFKFRTMCADAEAKKQELMKYNKISSDFMFKIDNDPRITKVGRILRKTSIDELPQFFNVLGGSMSLVGTRPPTVDEVEKYKRNHWRRISIKPGITGMWQVSGRSNITDFEQVVELDTEYIDTWNIFLDFKIMIKTVLQVFSKKNDAY